MAKDFSDLDRYLEISWEDIESVLPDIIEDIQIRMINIKACIYY